MNSFIGYCKECGAVIHEEHEIMPGDGVYECPVCFHPHAKDEIWDIVPPYIEEEVRALWPQLSIENTEEF